MILSPWRGCTNQQRACVLYHHELVIDTTVMDALCMTLSMRINMQSTPRINLFIIISIPSRISANVRVFISLKVSTQMPFHIYGTKASLT